MSNKSPDMLPSQTMNENGVYPPFFVEFKEFQKPESIPTSKRSISKIIPNSNASFEETNPILTHFSPEKIEKQLIVKDPLFSKRSSSLPILLPSPTSSIWGTLLILFHYIFNSLSKSSRSFKIGVFSIFIVVGFLTLMQSALQLSPVVFLKIAEGQVGDADLMILPLRADNDSRLQDSNFAKNPLNSIRLLNAYDVEKSCDLTSGVVGCSSRWIFTADVKKSREQSGKGVRSYVMAVESSREKSIGLGRNLDVKALGTNESWVTYSTVRSLGLDDNVNINIDVLGSLIKQNFLTLNDQMIQFDKPIEEMNDDEKIEAFKSYLHSQIASLISQNLFTSDTTTATISTSVIKTTANDTRSIIEGANIDENQNVFSYFFDRPNAARTASNNYGLPTSTIEAFRWSTIKNFSDFLERTQNLPENQTFNPNATIEILINSIVNTLNLSTTMKIKQDIRNPKGKWSESLGNMVVFEYSNMNRILYENLMQSLDQEIKNNASDPNYEANTFLLKEIIIQDTFKNYTNLIDFKTLAMTENMVVDNRIEIYSDSDMINKKFIEISNKFSKNLGKNYPASYAIPLSSAVQAVLLVKNFLDNVFVSAVFILILLSVLLIYSLMISNVDEKTYEFGMLRALGLKSKSLIVLLLIEGLIYAIPGMSLGLIFSFIFNATVSQIIYDTALEAGSYQLHFSAVIMGFMLGIIMPLISNSLPIYRALSKTLKDSLDLFHRTIDEISVKTLKLEKLGISFSQFFNSVTLIVMGITTYYFAPMAFVKQDIKLFLAIMNIVLVFLILGFTIFVNLFQNAFQRLLVRLFVLVCYKDRFLAPIILKNMSAHNRRNSKTALMFCICLAFLIFAGAGFNQQTNVIENTLKLQIGSDMTAEVAPDEGVGLDESKLRGFLENYMKQYPNNLASYTFITFPLHKIPDITKPIFSPLSGYPSKFINIYGVERNFLRSTFTKFFLPTEYNDRLNFPTLPDGKKDAVAGLFNPEIIEFPILDQKKLLTNGFKRPTVEVVSLNETITLILPEGARTGLAVDTQTPCELKISGGYQPTIKGKIGTMAAKIPGFGFSFSSYQTIVNSLTGITSMEQMAKLRDASWKSIYIGDDIKKWEKKIPANLTNNLPKMKLFVKFNKPLDTNERIELANGIRNYFLNDLTLLSDTNSLVETIQTAFFFIDLFYVIVSLISVILSFFLILVSFVSNVKENSWEFGVLRAIGLTKAQMTRIYIYEATALTLSSGLLGTTVGIVVAITLVMQFLVFTELPFEFLFPTNIFCVTFFSGTITAILGSYYAVKEMREKPIAYITKGL